MEGGGFVVVFVRAISRRKAKEGDGKRKRRAEFRERGWCASEIRKTKRCENEEHL